MRQAVADALSHPGIVLREIERAARGGIARDPAVEQRTRLEERRRRLRRLYALGEIDDGAFESELAEIKGQLARLDNVPEPSKVALPKAAEIAAVCDRVREWLLDSGRSDLPMIADALQLDVRATHERAEVRGVIPDYAPSCEHADVCSVVIKTGPPSSD